MHAKQLSVEESADDDAAAIATAGDSTCASDTLQELQVNRAEACRETGSEGAGSFQVQHCELWSVDIEGRKLIQLVKLVVGDADRQQVQQEESELCVEVPRLLGRLRD